MNARTQRLVKAGFVSVREAAVYLGISKTTMYELVKSKTITHAIFGGRIAISRQALEDYAALHLVIGKLA